MKAQASPIVDVRSDVDTAARAVPGKRRVLDVDVHPAA